MKEKGEVTLFFRVLHPRVSNEFNGDDTVCSSTYEDWLNKKNTSTHGKVPLHWVKIWQNTHSTNSEDYPLPYQNGKCWWEYTEAARDHFISLLRNSNDTINFDCLPQIDLLKCGEYKGVSAYDNLQDALNYAYGSPSASIAVFCGQASGVLPDSDDFTRPTAYAAEVIRKIKVVSLANDECGRTITTICTIPEQLREYIIQ